MTRKRHGGWAAVILACAAGAGQTPDARAGEIRIWPTAVAAGDSVTLADVADLRGFAPSVGQALGEIVVGAAPRAGGEILLHFSDIRGALAEADADLSGIRIFGASRCKVSRPMPPRDTPAASPKQVRTKQKPVQRPRPERQEEIRPAERRAESAQTLEAAIRQFIEARAGVGDVRVEIRFSPANRGDLDLSRPECDFDIRAQDERLAGLVSLEVDIRREGRIERTVPVVAEVSLVQNVVVARRAINRGKAIESRDLKLEERRFSDFESVGMTELSAAIGQQSRTFVKAGDMLQAKWLELKPLIARGDQVTIWSRRGGLVIKSAGTAQQAGSLGDVIEVRRDGSKRKQDLIEALVSGPATVSVDGERQVSDRLPTNHGQVARR